MKRVAEAPDAFLGENIQAPAQKAVIPLLPDGRCGGIGSEAFGRPDRY